MGWNGMFKKFNRKTVTDTDVVAQRGISAGGDVTGIREVAPEDVVDRERFDVVTEANLRLRSENARLVAENVTLGKEVEKLRNRLGEEYDRGYEDALKKVFNVIEERDGRSGKKQILSDVQDLLAAHREEN